MPVSGPAPVRQPNGAVSYSPSPGAGYGPPQLVSVPMIKSCQLVRGGIDSNGMPVDPYAAYLSTLRELQPGDVPDQVFSNLIPDENQAAMIQTPVAANEHTEARINPADDAFGPAGGQSRRLAPLVLLR